MPRKQSTSTADTLTLREIATLVANSVRKQHNRTVNPELVKWIYAALIEIITEELKQNGKFTITNIGTFNTHIYGGFTRNTYNVNTRKQSVEIVPERVVVRYTPSQFLKAYLNNQDISLGTKTRKKVIEKKEKASVSKKALLEKEKKLRNQEAYEKLMGLK